MKKVLFIILAFLMSAFLLSGCIPAAYKEGVDIDKGFPDSILEIYDDAIVFFSEDDGDEIMIAVDID